MRGAYIRKDFDRPLDWLFLNGWEDDMFDLFGDGTIKTYFTPGHTPGHMSLMVNLPTTGKLLFTSDACYLDANLNGAMSGLAWSFGEAEKSMQRINKLCDAEGAKVVLGHDPVAWQKLKRAPDFYE